MHATFPAAVSSFVGRTVESAAIRELIGRERLVTVVGPGGCGKTRLCIETLRDRPDVYGFVELAAVSSRRDLVRAVLSACGGAAEPGRPGEEQLAEHVGAGPGVLVLDNCEHLYREVAVLVTALLGRCPRLQIVATSRVSLGVPGEALVQLVGLDPDAALALVLDRTRAAVHFDAVSDDVAREICTLAQGLPLALELAAAHARALPLADIRDGMAARIDFLTSRDPSGVPRHSSLVASLDWSVELIGGRARNALAALSVVAGRFPLDVALALVEGDRAAFETVVDHSLVQFDGTSYVLLDTVREYAARMLAESGTGEQVHHRLSSWAAAFAARTRTGLERAEPDALGRAEAADAAVRSALSRAVTTHRGLDLAASTAVDLAFAWSLRGRCPEGLEHVRQIAAVLDPVPPPLRWAQAFLACYGGDMGQGAALAEAAARAAEAAGDDRTQARAETLVAMVLEFVDPAAAAAIVADAAARAEHAGDDWCRVEALQILAYCHVMRSAPEAALRAADATLPALERLGHRQLKAWDCGIRAEVAVAQGHYADAEDRGRSGLALAVAIGEPVSAIGCLAPLVRARLATGSGTAATIMDEHRDFFAAQRGLGVDETLAVLDAAIEVDAGSATATAVAGDALAGAEAIEVDWLAAQAADLLAVALLGVGDAAAARAAAAQAADVAATLGHRGLVGQATLTGAAADRTLGDRDPNPAVHAVLAEASSSGLRPLVIDALELVAALAADAGRELVATRLRGAVDGIRGRWGAVPGPLARSIRASVVLSTRPETVDPTSAESTLDLDGAVAYATRARGRRSRPSTGWDSLTPTENQVVALVAAGMTNDAVGRRLLVTAGTVRTHLRSVFNKLGVSSRTELAALAVRREQ